MQKMRGKNKKKNPSLWRQLDIGTEVVFVFACVLSATAARIGYTLVKRWA